MCQFSYPAPEADIFSELEKGSVVVLFQGAGYPPIEAVSTTEVILAVDKFSALTNTGRLLACTDAALIDVLSETLAEGEYEVSPRAQELLDLTQSRPDQGDTDWAADLREDLL
ncbi:MAG: hypothetical protein WAV56_01350 [Microgenomates group bacterium]